MEAAGAVFLPAAGTIGYDCDDDDVYFRVYRIGSVGDNFALYGSYWSASPAPYGDSKMVDWTMDHWAGATSFNFEVSLTYSEGDFREFDADEKIREFSVRLVSDDPPVR